MSRIIYIYSIVTFLNTSQSHALPANPTCESAVAHAKPSIVWRAVRAAFSVSARFYELAALGRSRFPQNQWIDPTTSLFKMPSRLALLNPEITSGEIRTWPLEYVLAVVTNQAIPGCTGLGQFGEIVGFLVGHEPQILFSNERGDRA